jgi:hypothetical protein
VSFTIHRVTQRAHGGEPIQRSKRVEGDVASIGRGTDCDIQLPDLTIGLHHADMRITGRGEVAVEALGDYTFEAHGTVVRRAKFRVLDRPKLVFASYLLAFAPETTQDEVAVTVTHASDGGEIADQSSERKVFSLAPNAFGLRRAAWLLGLLVLAIGLAVPVAFHFLNLNASSVAPQEQWSPGPLSQGHSFLQHNCEACHAKAFHAILDAACLACHQNKPGAKASTAIAVRVLGMGSLFPPDPAQDHAAQNLLSRATGGAGVFEHPAVANLSNFMNRPGQRCISCHTDHVGNDGHRMAATQATTAETLTTDCTSCHAALKSRLPDTAVLDVVDWGQHPDFRLLMASLVARGRPNFDRDSMTDGPFDKGLKFSHRTHLSPTGDVAREALENSKPVARDGRLSCSACHQPDMEGRGFLPIEMTKDCSACHSLRIRGIDGRPDTLPHGDIAKAIAKMRSINNVDADAGLRTARLRPGTSEETSTDQSLTSMTSTVTRKIRALFTNAGATKGLCYGCHAFVAPKDPDSVEFKVVRVQLTNRYLPRSGFDHSVPAHLLNANGKPGCVQCHATNSSESLSNVIIPGISQCKLCHGNATAPWGEAAASNCTECHGYHNTGDPPAREIYERPWRLPPGL